MQRLFRFCERVLSMLRRGGDEKRHALLVSAHDPKYIDSAAESVHKGGEEILERGEFVPREAYL